MKMDMKNKKSAGIVALVIVVLIFLGINAKSIGQRFGVTPGGDISLTAPVPGSTVYMDAKQLQVTTANDQTLQIKGVSTQTAHSIIVSKQGFWPWSKSIKVKTGTTIALKAFNGPSGQNVTDIPSSSSEYVAALAALKKAGAPSKSKMIVSPNSNVGIWMEGNDIYAGWLLKGTPDDFFCLDDHLCRREEMVFRGTAPITVISFYKNRNDVVFFSSGGSIFAIEIDQKGTQNFQPVYEGADTIFAPAGDNFLYVKDSGKIMKLSL